LNITPILLISFLVLGAACGKREAVWDELSEADQRAIRGRAYGECKSDSVTTFENFVEKSSLVWTSGDWQRNDAWKHTFTEGSSVITTKIRIWKNNGTMLYLAITDDVTTTAPYFLRIPKAANETMITHLKEQICRGHQSVSAKGGEDGPLTVGREYTTTEAAEVNTITDTYSFNFAYPAFVATEWNLKRRILKKKSDGTQISDKTSTSSFTKLTGEDDLPTTATSWATKYCDIFLPEVVPPGAELENPGELRYVVPYQLGNNDTTPGTLTCNVGTLPTGWDLSI